MSDNPTLPIPAEWLRALLVQEWERVADGELPADDLIDDETPDSISAIPIEVDLSAA